MQLLSRVHVVHLGHLGTRNLVDYPALFGVRVLDDVSEMEDHIIEFILAQICPPCLKIEIVQELLNLGRQPLEVSTIQPIVYTTSLASVPQPRIPMTVILTVARSMGTTYGGPSSLAIPLHCAC